MVPDLAMAKVVKRQQWLRGNIWSLRPLKTIVPFKSDAWLSILISFRQIYYSWKQSKSSGMTVFWGWDVLQQNTPCLSAVLEFSSTFWRIIFYPCHTSVSCCFLYILLTEHDDFYKQLTYFSICLKKISTNTRSVVMSGSFHHCYHCKEMIRRIKSQSWEEPFRPAIQFSAESKSKDPSESVL